MNENELACGGEPVSNFKMKSIKYPSESCPRCNGSGKYSYNEVHGSMCYGCHGTGKILTKEGERIKKTITKLQDKLWNIKATEVRVGDSIYEKTLLRSGWSIVTEIKQVDDRIHISVENKKDKSCSGVVLQLDSIVSRYKPWPESLVIQIKGIKGLECEFIPFSSEDKVLKAARRTFNEGLGL